MNEWRAVIWRAVNSRIEEDWKKKKTTLRLANGMANPSVVCLSSVTCVHPTQGF